MPEKTPFDMLSSPIKKYIYNKGWEKLRLIQASSIKYITETDDNYIIAASTASGKTEAAFLPILSRVNFAQSGVKVLYISPLIALINDQFFRIEELCKYLDIKVTKWHGEAKISIKEELIKNPNGIVLITPESIEAMLVKAPYKASKLFSNLEYIVIDEVHSFLGADRGIQLMSLLSRLQKINKKKFKIVGLSATIGNENYQEIKKITGDIENTKVLLDPEKKEAISKFKYFKNETSELPTSLLYDLYEETKDNKVLIFPNSRQLVEEIAVKLQKISTRLKGHQYYYSHHSAIDKKIREHIEFMAKNSQKYNFCIACTSTLELGIDIGSINKIVQIDSTYSVSSMVQRIGRSGRKEEEISNITIYTTNEWEFLQSLSCWNLYQRGELEPLNVANKPYDILFHQMLSLVKQYSEIEQISLINSLSSNFAFNTISRKDIELIIDDAIKNDYLEKIQNKIILGMEGEKLVNSRDFYSVFTIEPNFSVIYQSNKIGELAYSPQIIVNEKFFLAAKVWEIKEIDLEKKKIFVTRSFAGKPPSFAGNGGNINKIIREEALKILKNNEVFPQLDEDSNIILKGLRYYYKNFDINNFQYDRPAIEKDDNMQLYSFTSSKIDKSLLFLLSYTEIEASLDYNDSNIPFICFKNLKAKDFNKIIIDLTKVFKGIDGHLEVELEKNKNLISFSKWGKYLPLKFQCEIVKERFFNFEEALVFITNINLVMYNTNQN